MVRNTCFYTLSLILSITTSQFSYSQPSGGVRRPPPGFPERVVQPSRLSVPQPRTPPANPLDLTFATIEASPPQPPSEVSSEPSGHSESSSLPTPPVDEDENEGVSGITLQQENELRYRIAEMVFSFNSQNGWSYPLPNRGVVERELIVSKEKCEEAERKKAEIEAADTELRRRKQEAQRQEDERAKRELEARLAEQRREDEEERRQAAELGRQVALERQRQEEVRRQARERKLESERQGRETEERAQFEAEQARLVRAEAERKRAAKDKAVAIEQKRAKAEEAPRLEDRWWMAEAEDRQRRGAELQKQVDETRRIRADREKREREAQKKADAQHKQDATLRVEARRQEALRQVRVAQATAAAFIFMIVFFLSSVWESDGQ
jgi:hypothetical protein